MVVPKVVNQMVVQITQLLKKTRIDQNTLKLNRAV